ncbi:XRE family transcriptional regulator [Arthrobacter gyeryongensis]|uniref:XRE family transcriptional regulator n=1 Tax=Arthrobacter gyeryongensis TaxID=1650592 RepID=A0ABP9SDN1_9MICC
MPSIPALVEVSVLRWARETCGLSDLAASRKIGVPDDRVALWESGQQQPTVAQLKKAAAVYKRSLSVFFLSEPPSGFDTLRDFRRMAGSEAGEWSPDLHDEYRRAHTQRDYLLELSELDDQDIASAWRLPETPGSDEELARAGRDALLAASALDLPQNAGTPYEHLNFWISALEEAGVLVAATRGGRIAVKEMRAFSLHFDVLPVIVVNGADSPRGRLFSLMHEYAHLLLHTEGLCDTTTDLRATSPDRELEARCNAIAGSLLVPGNVLLSRPEVIARRDSPNTWDYETLKPVAAAFGVSAEVILRRLTILGRVSRTFYEQQRETFLAAYEREEVQSRAGGGNWYRNTVRDLGKGYVRHVADAHRRRVIDSNTAAIYLNVKVGQISRLAETASLRTVI